MKSGCWSCGPDADVARRRDAESFGKIRRHITVSREREEGEACVEDRGGVCRLGKRLDACGDLAGSSEVCVVRHEVNAAYEVAGDDDSSCTPQADLVARCRGSGG